MKWIRYKKTIWVYTKEQRDYDTWVLQRYREYSGDKSQLWTFRRRIKKWMYFEEAILPTK